MNRTKGNNALNQSLVNKLVNSLITKSDYSGYFFNRQVAGRFHNDSLPNTLLIYKAIHTTTHIYNQIFTTYKNSSLKIKKGVKNG